jgi:hypothetical protein
LGQSKKGDEGKSRQGMPQVKGLKELKLLVKQRNNAKIWQTIYDKHILLPYFL